MRLRVVFLVFCVFVLNIYASSSRYIKLSPGYNKLPITTPKYFGQEFLDINGKMVPIYEGEITRNKLKLNLLTVAAALTSEQMKTYLGKINDIENLRKKYEDKLNNFKNYTDPGIFFAKFLSSIVGNTLSEKQKNAFEGAISTFINSDIKLGLDLSQNPSKAKIASALLTYFYTKTVVLPYNLNGDLSENEKKEIIKNFKEKHWFADWLITNGVTATVDLAWAYKEKTNVSFSQAFKSVGGFLNLAQAISTAIDSLRLINLMNAYQDTYLVNWEMKNMSYVYKFIRDYAIKYNMNINSMKYSYKPKNEKEKLHVKHIRDYLSNNFYGLFYYYIYWTYGYQIPSSELPKLADLTLKIIRKYGDGANFKIGIKISSKYIIHNYFNKLYWMPQRYGDKGLEKRWGMVENTNGYCTDSGDYNSICDNFPTVHANKTTIQNPEISLKHDIIKKDGKEYLYLHDIRVTINYNALIEQTDTYFQIYPKKSMTINGILIPLYSYSNINDLISGIKNDELKSGLQLLYKNFALPYYIKIDYKKWLYSPVKINDLVKFTSLAFNFKKNGYVKNLFLNKEKNNTDPTIRKNYYEILVKIYEDNIDDRYKNKSKNADLLAKLELYGLSKINTTIDSNKDRNKYLNGTLTNAEAIVLSYRLYKAINRLR